MRIYVKVFILVYLVGSHGVGFLPSHSGVIWGITASTLTLADSLAFLMRQWSSLIA
jgi:hypothetical protein